MAADGHIVLVVRQRERRDADGVRLDLVVEHPDRLKTVFHVVEHRLVKDDEQISVRQGETIVRAAAKWRRPNAMDDKLRVSLIRHVDARQASVAPGAIGDVFGDDCMMEAVTPAFEWPPGFFPIPEV